MPKRRANLGAKGDRIAKASKGTVVIVPAKVLDIPKLSRIEATSGPTDVKGALRLAPIRIMPIISNPILGFICSFGCSS